MNQTDITQRLLDGIQFLAAQNEVDSVFNLHLALGQFDVHVHPGVLLWSAIRLALLLARRPKLPKK